MLFDPHCTHLPDITAANPGKKLDFVAHDILHRYPDQCAPYLAFGCDMRSEFSGTLFRFPLRTPEAAATSQIATQV